MRGLGKVKVWLMIEGDVSFVIMSYCSKEPKENNMNASIMLLIIILNMFILITN